MDHVLVIPEMHAHVNHIAGFDLFEGVFESHLWVYPTGAHNLVSDAWLFDLADAFLNKEQLFFSFVNK